MISNSERCEIVAGLRDAAGRGNGERVTDGELVDVIAYAIGVEGAEGFDDRLLARLADLIDRPTCENIGGEDGTNGEYYDFFCSACGFAADVTDPKYCPNCGAEVVDDD